MVARKLYGLDGIVDLCQDCNQPIKAGAWLKDAEPGKPRILLVLSYCKRCKKHLRSTYLLQEQYSFAMGRGGEAVDERVTCAAG